MAHPGPITVHVTGDPDEFLRDAGDLLESEPVVHSILASNVLLARRHPGRIPDPWWIELRRGARVVGVAMHTPPYPPHLPLSSPVLAVAVARELADRGRPVDGVGGLRDGAVAFSDWWCAEKDLDADVVMDLGMYDLPRPARLPFAVAGGLRPAIPADLDLVRGWLQDFHHEAHGPSAPPAPDPSPHVLEGRTAVWEVDGRPVSMCYATAPSGGVTRISGVWTPPGERGRGYASAVVATWSRHQQELGLRCMLLTDLANPTSNGIYQALGYRRIGDSVTLAFTSERSG
ncbi:GNAT family N-acetyltransferase [Arsenicicoccus cauae]|uniref:GNAT family N-acetyltransferase n=1 Tax=Arsenicicoccus cauae TaxID=2663847 RepID=UPI002595A543|nr:GNAT family N-acetyltransferase [uncultured Arsenicicoccus sp.]